MALAPTTIASKNTLAKPLRRSIALNLELATKEKRGEPVIGP
jgi:hypothetical protein